MLLSVNFKGSLKCFQIDRAVLGSLVERPETGVCELESRLSCLPHQSEDSQVEDVLLNPMASQTVAKPKDLVVGWSAVLTESDDSAADQLIDIDLSSGFVVMQYRITRRVVSETELKRKVAYEVEKLRQSGQRISRDLRRALTEETRQALMTEVPPKITHCPVAIDLNSGFLFIGASSSDTLEMVVTALFMLMPEVELEPLYEPKAIERLFASWLTDRRLPAGLELGDSVDFAEQDAKDGEAVGLIRYRNMSLEDIDEVPLYATTKAIKMLSLCAGTRLSFNTTPDLNISGLKWLKRDESPAPLKLLSAPMTKESYAALEAKAGLDDTDELDFADPQYFLLHLLREGLVLILRDADRCVPHQSEALQA